jgi:pimeloyl-ACP methyl ester carboxylesterase/predicted glycosyltransferase
MSRSPVLPERIGRLAGPLPEPGRLSDAGSYPFETAQPSSDGFIERDGVRTYFAVWGEQGPWVVFAPNYQIVHMQYLKATVPYLARHYRVVTMDLRGAGRSDRPLESAAYSFEQYYADVVAVLDHLGITRLAIVGMSAAAMLAIRFAAEQPQRVSHLITVGGEFEWLTSAAPGEPPAYVQRIREDYAGYIDDFFDRLFAEPHSTKQYEDGVLYGWSNTGETLALATAGWAGSTVRDQAPRVTAPTLIIHGTLDHHIAYAAAQELHELIPHSELLTFEDGAHGPQARDPVRFNHALRDFIGARRPERTWTRAMSRPRRALFLSSPIGLGHVQRDVAIARELRKLQPDLQIEWFTVSPATAYLEREGERVHPVTKYLANESRHFEHIAGEHDLSAFYGLRTMDEIMVNNFMTFSDLMDAEHFDLVIGDEAWDVDYYYHENPELKRQPFVFLTDFVGMLPVEGDAREAFLCADRNADDLAHIARFPYIRDAAIFIGNPDDVVDARFGPDLPVIREWTDQNFRYSGYTLPFNPADVADQEALRAKLGYRQDETLIIAAVGGTSVGGHLLRKIIAAFPLLKRQTPNLRLVLVTGPRFAGELAEDTPGLEVRRYVHNLYEHLACCDLALVQGGLSTCMELVATRKPFLCFPLQRHFEQLIHVQRRLRNYGADCAVSYPDVTPESLAERVLERLHAPAQYRPVESDGAARAANMIAHVLEDRAAVR